MLAVHHLLVLVVCDRKQLFSQEKFVDHYSERPNISFLAEVSRIGLGSGVLKGSNVGGDESLFLRKYFRQSIVCELEVSLFGDQDVFWFKLSIDDSLFVKNAEADYDFSCNIDGLLFCEVFVLLLEVVVKIAHG